MNYDLFAPAAGPTVSTRHPDRVPGGRQDSASAVAGIARVGDEAALRPLQSSASEQLSSREVQNTVAAFNDVFEQANISVRYRVDEDTDDLVITLVNRETDEVLRQLPPDQILKMRERLEELMGLMFDGTA